MSGKDQAITAARFSISIDGVQIGRFEMLLAATAPGAAPRSLPAHELARVAQQTAAPPSGHRDAVIVLKRGTASRGAIDRWKATRGGQVALAGLDLAIRSRASACTAPCPSRSSDRPSTRRAAATSRWRRSSFPTSASTWGRRGGRPAGRGTPQPND